MSLNIPLLRESFEKIAPRADAFAAAFYENLFETAPQIKPLFEKVTLEDQRQKLVQSLIVILKTLDQPVKLSTFLVDLGHRHHTYGVQSDHYDLVGGALLETLAEYLADDWNSELAGQWAAAYGEVARLMQSAPVVMEAHDYCEIPPPPPSLEADDEADHLAAEHAEELYEELYAEPVAARVAGTVSAVRSDSPGRSSSLHDDESHFEQPAELFTPPTDPHNLYSQNTKQELPEMSTDLKTNPVAATTSTGQASQFYAMVEEMPINVMLADLDLKITYLNKASENKLRELSAHLPIPVEKFIGQSIDIFHKNPEHQRKMLKDPKNLPHRAQIAVGPEILDLLVSPLVDHSGNYLGPMVTWELVTEKVRLENEMVRIKNMMDSLPINVMMADRDLTLTYMNPASFKTLEHVKHLLPVPVNQMIGRKIDIFHKQPERQRQMLADPKNLPHKADIPLGDEILSLHVAAIFDMKGEYIGPMISWDVVTKQRELEAETKDLAGQIDAIRATQAVIEFDTAGNIRYANELFLNVLRYQQQEIIGKHHRMFVDEQYANSPEYKKFWAELAGGETKQGDFPRITKSGETIWIQASYTPICGPDGKPYKVVKFAYDVTEKYQAKANFLKTADDFERDVKGVVQVVTSSATEMQASAQSMSGLADQTSRQSQLVAAASEEATKNVQTVASSAEELSASIAEIARHVQDASRMTAKAVQEADRTNLTIKELGDSSEQIGQVIKVITSIAQQTNLLALNATIEAARAGEAGKGFAVVANEVKELARQTAKATEEISQKIGAIQSATGGAAAAIASISDSITRINEISTTIASAVEEQTAATNEISRNVAEAATGTAEVTMNISNVSSAASESGNAASDILTAASGLAKESAMLNDVTTQFLVRMRNL